MTTKPRARRDVRVGEPGVIEGMTDVEGAALTPGAIYYFSSGGAITKTKPASATSVFDQIAGRAISTSGLRIQPPYHHGGADTERAAADSVVETSRPLRQKVLKLLQDFGPMIDEEILEQYHRRHGHDGTDYMAIERRRHDLKHLELIVDSTERRLNSRGRRCIVWEVVPF